MPAPSPTTVDLDHLRTWIGAVETRAERLGAFPSDALAATLDRDEPPRRDGDPLPLGWHWLHFLSAAPLAGCGPDGHAARGGFLPPVPLPRRMWAGGRLRALAPLRVGATLTRTSTVLAVEHRHGRSGELVFVTVGHAIGDGEATLLEEEHDIVYRAAAGAADRAPAPAPAPSPAPVIDGGGDGGDGFSREVRTDPVLLFRYSALTFNGHRIHYDRPWATGAEGYPGLVVHAPLLVTLLLDLLARERPELAVTGLRFRNVAPVFDTDAVTLHGAPRRDGTVALRAVRADGTTAVEATATVTPPTTTTEDPADA